MPKEERQGTQRGLHYHSHFSLCAFRLKLAFSFKRTKHAHSSITSEATAGSHVANELIRILEMVMVDHTDCLANHNMKRCYFPSQPRLNLNICNGQILIQIAQYMVHHHEILNPRPHTVHMQGIHIMHMERVMAVRHVSFQYYYYYFFFTVQRTLSSLHKHSNTFKQYQASEVL